MRPKPWCVADSGAGGEVLQPMQSEWHGAELRLRDSSRRLVSRRGDPDPCLHQPEPLCSSPGHVRQALATIEMPRRRWLLLALALGTASLSFVSRFPTRSTTPSRTRRTRLGALTKEELEAVKAWEQKEEVVTDAREGDMIASHKFPIPAEELIQRTKLYLAKNQYGIKEPDMLAEDFEFVGQVIGPLGQGNLHPTARPIRLAGGFPGRQGSVASLSRGPLRRLASLVHRPFHGYELGSSASANLGGHQQGLREPARGLLFAL